ncbi:MAG: porin [Planctomycetota bacterium]|nr:porin [Planctomycetota bacterium]
MQIRYQTTGGIRPKCMLLAIAFSLILCACSSLNAQYDGFTSLADEPTKTDELELLKKRIDDLEKTVKSSGKSDSKKPSDSDKGSKGSDSGKDSGKDADKKPKDSAKDSAKDTQKWTVKLGGHVQMDYVNWAQADPAIPNTQDYFEFRRLRLVADGTGYGNCDFRLQMTLEPESQGESPIGQVTSPEVKDAYFSMNEIPVLGRMRVGNFFVPFSLEQVTNDTMNIFMERSIPTQGVFAADREVGLAFYNCNDAKSVTWSSGFFLDSISEATKERLDDNQGCRVSGRLTWLPYYDEASNGRYLVHTGLGVLYTHDQDKRVRFRARPQIREGTRIIDSGVLLADDYTTGNLESAIVWGRFTVQSEAFLSSVHRLDGSTNQFNGAYLHTSYFLTGENRIFERFGQHGAQFSRNVPKTNFSLTRKGCGWGAWEAKARWSHLDLNDVNAGQYNDFTFGFNWYWSDRTRMMFDWIHPITSQQAVFGATNSDILASRFDFNW